MIEKTIGRTVYHFFKIVIDGGESGLTVGILGGPGGV